MLNFTLFQSHSVPNNVTEKITKEAERGPGRISRPGVLPVEFSQEKSEGRDLLGHKDEDDVSVIVNVGQMVQFVLQVSHGAASNKIYGL